MCVRAYVLEHFKWTLKWPTWYKYKENKSLHGRSHFCWACQNSEEADQKGACLREMPQKRWQLGRLTLDHTIKHETKASLCCRLKNPDDHNILNTYDIIILCISHSYFGDISSIFDISHSPALSHSPTLNDPKPRHINQLMWVPLASSALWWHW